jgi:hypothetical protein
MNYNVSVSIYLKDATVSDGVININVYSGDRKSTINCSQ